MKTVSQMRRQAIVYIDRYFAGVLSAEDLRTWALAQPIFASPKALDNTEDWIVSNALALMIALTDSTPSHSDIENELREARQLLTGGTPFPDDHWPSGLLR